MAQLMYTIRMNQMQGMFGQESGGEGTKQPDPLPSVEARSVRHRGLKLLDDHEV